MADTYIEQYFLGQNPKYVQELAEWEKINSPSRRAAALVFVVCRGEAERLANLIKIYDDLVDSNPGNPPIVTFVLNASQDSDEDEEFQSQSVMLAAASESRPWLHLIEKRFPTTEACLGRARKYGLDYCLWLSRKSTSEDPVIVSNEGDMIAVNENYLDNFVSAFERTGPGLIQGSVAYPDYCKKSSALSLFLNAREAVHHGQGIHYSDFKGFLGILPVGRNFAVSSSVAAAANSIDPIRRRETDDDMNFGADIFFLGGHSLKRFIDNPIITSPRREIEIVSSILSGDSAGTQNAYENFHGSFELYRKGECQLRVALLHLKQLERDLLSSNVVLNSYFSWLFRSRMIEKLPPALKKEIDSRYAAHKIGYWARERLYFDAYSDDYEEEKSAAEREAKAWLVRLLEAKGVYGVDVSDLAYVE